MKCAEVREALPAYVRGEDHHLSVRRHVSRCPDCTAEAARYDSLVRALGALEAAPAEVPPGLAAALHAIPEHQSRIAVVRSHVSRNRNAYIGGLAVAAVGAAGAVLWRSHRSGVAAARA